jgi:hypothetical protein
MSLRECDEVYSSGPRAVEGSFTTEFAGAWPHVEPALRRFLASRSATRHEIDDVVQEVAARALQRQVPFTTAGELRAWCFVVGRRLLIDSARRSARVVELDSVRAVPDPRQAQELDRVEDRHLIAAVTRAISTLDALHARALDPYPTDASSRERNRAAVARHRARQRLRRQIGPFAVVPLAWFRRSMRTVGASPVATGTVIPAVAIAVALPALVLIAPLAAPAPSISLALHGSPQTAHVGEERPKPHTAASSSHPRVANRHTDNRSRAATIVVARAPNHTWVDAGTQPKKDKSPLVCTGGNPGPSLCVSPPVPL